MSMEDKFVLFFISIEKLGVSCVRINRRWTNYEIIFMSGEYAIRSDHTQMQLVVLR